MPDAQSKVNSKLRGTARQRARARKANTKERLAKLVKAVGNDEIQKRIQQGNVNRDMAMAYITERLRNMQALQQRELKLMPRTSHWEWWRQVADDHKPWYTKPEPKRWHEAAKMYKEAAKHLARGDLMRGKQVMEKAMAEEDKQLDNLTDLVHTEDLDFDARPEVGWLEQIVSGTEGPCELPDDVKIADEIMQVMETVPDPMNRRRRRDPWWTLEEDEEEEEGDAAGAG
jgi:hypothetical protein